MELVRSPELKACPSNQRNLGSPEVLGHSHAGRPLLGQVPDMTFQDLGLVIQSALLAYPSVLQFNITEATTTHWT